MALSRRAFVQQLGRGTAGLASASFIIGHGHEELTALGYEDLALESALQASTGSSDIKLSSNENLRGPSPKVIEVLKQHPSIELGYGYPVLSSRAFSAALAKAHNVEPENVITATGSGAILQAAQRAYVTDSRPLVSGDPSYMRGAERSIPVRPDLYLDIDAMVDVSVGAGLVFLCNPNNPTSTIHTLAEIEAAVRAIKQRSPDTAILIDEAYIHYSTAPGIGSGDQISLEYPDVFMTRTFSKAFGMAGMRMGYGIGQPETLTKLRQAWGLGSINELQSVAGIAAIEDTAHMEWERQENKRIRDWTLSQFEAMGFDAPSSQTNFVFVNIDRPASEFRDACRTHGIRVGRDFPPMENTHARISLGTMENMEQAMEVFKRVLET